MMLALMVLSAEATATIESHATATRSAADGAVDVGPNVLLGFS
jgi:hypothetical protein